MHNDSQEGFSFRSLIKTFNQVFLCLMTFVAIIGGNSGIANLFRLVLVAIFVVIGIRYVISYGLSSLFWPERRITDPVPIIGPAYQARKDKRYGEAIAILLDVCKNFPNQAQSFMDLMDIYANEFLDLEQVDIVYRWGKNKIRNEVEIDRLKAAYTHYYSKLTNRTPQI